MSESTTFIGLDVHQASVMAAVWRPGASGPDVGPAPVVVPALVAWVQRAAAGGPVQVAYEAGPSGYPLQRACAAAGVPCVVVAPSLIPQVAGGRRQRIKTDRRDARQLVTFLRQRLLTPVHVPSPAEEAFRELTRCRQQLQRDVVRARQRVRKLLLRHGRTLTAKAWTVAYRTALERLPWAEPSLHQVCTTYLAAVTSAEQRLAAVDAALTAVPVPPPVAAAIGALRCFRGIDELTARTIAAEVGDGRRFGTARGFMHYTGLTCWEWSSGARRRQGGISKRGNAHLRRVLTEAAWHYRHRPGCGRALTRRQQGQPPAAIALAWRAQERLTTKRRRLEQRGKRSTVAVIAVARELAGFVWAVWQLPGVDAPAAA